MTLKTKLAAAAGAGLALAGAGAALAGGGNGTHEAARSRGAGDEAALRGGPPGPLGFRGPAHRGLAAGLQAAADYLGIPVATLVRDLVSGQTLAQVANATSGKSADGLIAALVAHEQAELADAVKAGRLTQAQADAIAQDLRQRVAERVDGVHPAPPALPRPGGTMGPGWWPFPHHRLHAPDGGGANA